MGKTVRKTQFKKETFPDNVVMTLNSTDDTDVIESSIVEQDNEIDQIKKGKIDVSKHRSSPKTPVQVKAYSSNEMKNSCSIAKETNTLKSSLTRNCGFQGENQLLKTPVSGQHPIETNSVMKKLISSLKKTPEGPYLSKSKLQNIQQWLMSNDTEAVRTPPFANLSVTPIDSCRRRLSSDWKNKQSRHEDSSLDSEIEGVLKAVYGNDWKRENIKNRPKTEPKKKSNFFSPASEVKQCKAGGFHSVRRKILSEKKLNSIDNSEEENKLDNSVLSGIKMINLDSSYSDEEEVRKKIGDSSRKTGKTKEAKNGVTIRVSNSPKENSVSKPPSSNHMNIQKPNPKDFREKNSGSNLTPRTPKKTFLASLSVSTPTSKCHPDAQQYKINFKSKKDELVKKLYKLYNSEVFDGKLAEDLNFTWNVKLRGTAGYCYNKRITKSTGEVIRMSRIEFSTKIVDRADRVRDTMIHELCHAASWMIDGVLDGHGEIWTKWASRAMRRFPELPMIKRCHNYDIVSKYLYRCTSCGYSIKRHSKSINTDKKRCGHCYGVLELLINRKRKGKGEIPEFDTTRTLPTPNKFAIFVKENYHSVKYSKRNAKHSEVMKILSQQYALTKNGTKSAGKSAQD